MLTGGEAGTNEEKYELLAYIVSWPVSGSPKRADAEQRLQERRTEGVGDAAQPLQQHGNAPPA